MVRRANSRPPTRKDTSNPHPDHAYRALGEAVPSNWLSTDANLWGKISAEYQRFLDMAR
jgi:hypothetical protein